MNALEALSRALFLSINATPLTPVWFIDAARFIAGNVIYLVPSGRISASTSEKMRRGPGLPARVPTFSVERRWSKR